MADDNPFAQFGTPQQFVDQTPASPAAQTDSASDASATDNPFAQFGKPQPVGSTSTSPPAQGQGYFSHALSQLGQTVSGLVWPDSDNQIYQAGKEAMSSVNDTLNPFSQASQAIVLKKIQDAKSGNYGSVLGDTLSDLARTGRGIASVAAFPFSPLIGAARDLIGHPYSALTGIPFDQNDTGAPMALPGSNFPTARDAADMSMQLLMRGGPEGSPFPIKPPQEPIIPGTEVPETGGFVPKGPVIKSAGQDTGNPTLLQTEQQARNNQSGPASLQQATAFDTQQQADVEAHRSGIVQSLDPSGAGQVYATNAQEGVRPIAEALTEQRQNQDTALAQRETALRGATQLGGSPLDAADTITNSIRRDAATDAQGQQNGADQIAQEREAIRADLNQSQTPGVLANTPMEAADIMAGGVQRAEEQERGAVNSAYQTFRNQDGVFNPEVFEDIGDQVKKNLNDPKDRVFLNDQTPYANASMQHLQDTLGAAAEDAADPESKSHPPFTPDYVNEVQKTLGQNWRSAQQAATTGAGLWSDARAAKRVDDAFNEIVRSNALDPEAFSGDGAAVADALDNANAMNGQLKDTFYKQSGDPASAVIQKIVGRGTGAVPPPNTIQNALYGLGQVPVDVARKLVSIFGMNSPEIGAVKQGLWSYLTELPQGVTEWSPAKVADRIYNFINGNGKTLADTYLSGLEKQRMLDHADSLRSSVQPKLAATDTVGKNIAKIVGDGGQPLTSEESSRVLFGRDGTGSPEGAKMGQYLLDKYGRDSPEFQAFLSGQHGALMNVDAGKLGFEPGKLADRIDKFGNSDTAQTLLAPEERQTYGKLSDALRQHEADTAAPGDPIDKIIAKITDPDNPASTNDIISKLTGGVTPKDRTDALNLAKRLKDHFGEDSPRWTALRQGILRHLDESPGDQDWTYAKRAKRIDNFLNVESPEMAKALYSPSEREMIGNYGKLLDSLHPPSGTSELNRAGLIERVHGVGKAMATGIGAYIGRTLATSLGIPGGEIVGELGGAYAGSRAGDVSAAVTNRGKGKQLQKQMPLLIDQLRNYQKAEAAAAKSGSKAAKVVAASALHNLSKMASPYGVSLNQQ